MTTFEPLTTKVTQHAPVGQKKLGNLTLEEARFWGRPNFSGEMDQFKDESRKFTVLIPNEAADELRAIGWNVKTKTHDKEGNALEEPISSMKVKLNFKDDPDHPGDVRYEKGPDAWIIMGEDREKLTSLTIGLLDRSRVKTMDMELRAWNYNKEEVDDGLEEPRYSARLVTIIVTIEPSLLSQKYGGLL